VRKSGTIGKLIPNLQARLVDDEGNDIKPGPENQGELWVRTYPFPPPSAHSFFLVNFDTIIGSSRRPEYYETVLEQPRSDKEFDHS
jgi:hypothetical protein